MTGQADSQQHCLELRPEGHRHAVHTLQQLAKGEVIVSLGGDLVNEPNHCSIQIDAAAHIGNGGQINDELHHSCTPNAFVDFSNSEQLVVRALKSIAPDEEGTIDYCASEERLTDTCECNCGAGNCYQQIRGYAFLDPEQREMLKSQLSPYLLTQYVD
jgi:hypothetical protein